MEQKPFEKFYGDWTATGVSILIFSLFLFAFTFPKKRVEWRTAGLYEAFLISLFTEMFGIPLTIYIISAIFGRSPYTFGLYESHLWAYLISIIGILSLEEAVFLVMSVSIVLIILGLLLLGGGWLQLYRAKESLCKNGLYGYIRHPQYLGLIMIVFAFNIQWPTFLTIIMAPFLIVVYVRLARNEEKELEKRFGEAFLDYKRRVNAFIPYLC